jgi:hypothetical protein
MFNSLKYGNYSYVSIYFLLNSSNIANERLCSGEKIGYFSNYYHLGNNLGTNVDYFPLDPAARIKY